MTKNVPQKLIDKIKKYGLSVQGKTAYKTISAGGKEEFSITNKDTNTFIVHPGADSRLNLNGSTKDAIFVLEKNVVVNWFFREEKEINNARKISAVLESGAKFNLIFSTRDKIGSDFKINFVLAGASATVNIEEALSGSNFAETSRDILINHLAPHTESSYFARAIVGDSAKVAIKIKTIIAKRASKSTAHQCINNLIISDKAAAKGWPQLEINNDDVVCNHALTVGHLNEEELFYASSRGIGRKKALAMIAEGFLQPIENKIYDLKGELI